MRRALVAGLVLAVLGILLWAPHSLAEPLSPAIGPAPPPPDALVSSVKTLDDHIDSTIHDVKSGDLKGDRLANAVDGLRDEMYALYDTFFPPVFGLPFRSVFDGFLGIKAYVGNAHEWVLIENDEKAEASLRRAKAKLADLRSLLTGAGASGVPQALLDGLTDLGGSLNAAIRHAAIGTITLSEVGDLERDEERLIRETIPDRIFSQTWVGIYGVASSLAVTLEKAEFGSPFGTEVTKASALDALGNARAAKQGLEEELVPPTARITATFFGKGASGACEDTATAPNNGETCYDLAATHPFDESRLRFDWFFQGPVQDAGCVKFSKLGDRRSVWHHGDEDSCKHELEGPLGHVGAVAAHVDDPRWTCFAVYLGTNDPDTSPRLGPPGLCIPGRGDVLVVVKMGVGPATDPRSTTAGDGTVTSNPVGISCGPGCSVSIFSFPHNSQVTLSAAPDGSSAFLGWKGGGCTGTGDCTVTVDRDKLVLATFQHN